MPSVLFLGESPPPGAPPDFRPFDCQSGDRLAKRALGLVSRAPLLAHVPRANVFDVPTGAGKGTPEWDKDEARENSDLKIGYFGRDATIVALGARPLAALRGEHLDFHAWERRDGYDLVAARHPSGRSTSLNTGAKMAEARRCLMPELVAGCPGLRPWHFDLDDVAVLADLAHAVSPHRPALAAAALVIACEVRRATKRFSDHKYSEICGADDSIFILQNNRAEAVDHSLRITAKVTQNGDDGSGSFACLWHDTIHAKEIATRERWCARQAWCADYPVEVKRATYGRLVALGVET